MSKYILDIIFGHWTFETSPVDVPIDQNYYKTCY